MIRDNLKNTMKLIRPSATLAINELALKLIKEGKEIFRLGFGQSPFPVPEKIVKALQKNAHQKNYLPVRGLFALRETIADFFKRKYNLDTTAENILIGPGSKELIYDFQMVFNIEELLLPTPSWVSYEPQAQLTNNEVVWLKTTEKNDWKIKPDDIVNHCQKEPEKVRVIILNYPSNPTGVTYSDVELKLLAKVFERYKIVVIADEIYGEVHHKGNHQTIAKYYPQGTIISTGLSKWAGAGGWRLGVFVFPQKLKYILDAMAIVASETFTSTCTPVQYAALEAYNEDASIELYLENSRKILKSVGLYVFNALFRIGVSMPKPEGGFYLFPNFDKWKLALHKKEIFTSEAFCNILLKETGVALLPGIAFGHSNESFTARLSYVDFEGAELLKIVEKNPNISVDEQFVERFCPKIILAIKRIEEWLISL